MVSVTDLETLTFPSPHAVHQHELNKWYEFNNTIISGNPQIWGYTPKFGGDTPKFGGVTPKFGGVTPKFGGDQKDEFQKLEKKFFGKIKEYYFVLFPQ